MPNPSIGSETFKFLRGVPQPLGEAVETVRRPGLDGYDVRKLGKQADVAVMESAVDVADASAVATKKAAYKAIKGTVVTVVDETGNSTANVLVENYAVIGEKRMAQMIGGVNVSAGSSGYWLTARWFLRELSTA